MRYDIINLIGGDYLSGYIIYWSKEFIDKLNKHSKHEKMSVVYSGYSLKLPSLKKIKVGDTVYAVTIDKNELCVMGKLTIEKIETAFDYLMRETGKPHDCVFPDNYAVKNTYHKNAGIKAGQYFYHTNNGHYDNIEDLPDGTKILVLEELTDIPHQFSQEPPAQSAAFALSGTNGSEIMPRIIPNDRIPFLLFGKEKKPLKTDKNGKIVNASIAGHARIMSDETQDYFNSLF